MSAVSKIKGLGRAVRYSVIGDWSPHKRYIHDFRAYLQKRDEQEQAIRNALTDVKATDDASLEQAKFNYLIALRGFSDDDIKEAAAKYRIDGIIFSLFAVITIGTLIYVMLDGVSITAMVGCFLTLILWTLRVFHAWWRYSQLVNRRLTPFTRWLWE